MTAINATLQSFFTDRLTRQKDASSHTIAAYRDTLRLLLVFAAATHKVPASSLQWDHLDAADITAFLDHLQKDRGNSARTRNARLSAIHSLFRYAALHHPEHAASIARVLAIPPQRVDRHLIDYLEDRGVRSTVGGAGSQHLDRAARLHVPGRCPTNRTTRV